MAENVAVIAVAKDGEIFGLLDVFVPRGSLKLPGGVLPKGAEAITFSKEAGKLQYPVRSNNIHGNQLPASESAWQAVLKHFE